MSSERKIKSKKRYVSFRGIDCAGNAGHVMRPLMAIIDAPEKTNPFWERFKARLAGSDKLHARISDELCLQCC